MDSQLAPFIRAQKEREETIRAIKNSGRTPIIVATDIASRDLDIPNVAQVINYDLPADIIVFEHRLGRSGSAGTVVTFVPDNDIEKENGIIQQLRDLFDETEAPWHH